MNISTKRPNKKQKTKIYITDITNQYFSKFIKEFKSSPYICYKKKQVHNEPTESYFILINHISKFIKTNKRVWLRTKGVKSDVDGTKCVNETIGHAKEKNQSVINSKNRKETEGIKVTLTCNKEENKYK